MKTVKYSFILPAYKSHFFKDALDSILTQTYKNFELIIVNDASPEDLESIVKSYDDPRIRYYVNEQNIGGKDLVTQWNHCLEYAKGDYVILASDDDIYHSEYLEKMNELVEKYPHVNAFKPRIQIIGADGGILSIEGYFKGMATELEYIGAWCKGYIESGIPQYIFKKEALIQLGGYISYPLAWHSDDATIMALANHGIASSSEILLSFRYSGINITTQQNSKEKLLLKLKATETFHQFLKKRVESLDTSNAEQRFIKNEIGKNLSKKLREEKVRNQYFLSSSKTIWSTIPELLKLECIRKKDIVRWFLSYLSSFFR